MIWSSYVEYDARTVPAEVHQRALELLPADTDTTSTAPNGHLSFYVNVEAPTAEMAAIEALRVTGDIVRQTYGSCAVYCYEIVPLEERERRNSEPLTMPELVGQAEIATLLNIKPARASQVVQTALFKRHAEPVARLAAGPVYLAAQVRAFAAAWDRKPGRPRKTDNQ
ncbi:hypothetical protein [Streptomyces sp. YIM S03343]